MNPATFAITPRLESMQALRRFARIFLLLGALSGLGALGGCASALPGANYEKTVSSALDTPQQTALGQGFAAAAAAHPGLSGFRLVPGGFDGFLLRSQMIIRAEKTLDMQYYIFRADETGKLLTDSLLRAADRGVRVRLLIDDVDVSGEDKQLEALDAHPNIEVRLFNPLAYRGNAKVRRWAELLFHAPRLDYRMHNKLMIADNATALVGGRNIGDEYFQVDPEGQLGDFETFAAGPVVLGLSKSFDEFWASRPAIPVAALANGPVPPKTLEDFRHELTLHRQEKRSDGSDYATRIAAGEPLAGMLGGRLPLVWAPVTLTYDSPEKKPVDKGEASGYLMRRTLLAALQKARSEFTMISSYLIPGKDGMQALHDLHDRGVALRILTNSMESNTEPAAQAGYLHYRTTLLRDDEAELYEMRARPESPRGTGQNHIMSSYGNFGLHTKVYVFDRERLFVASMNFDQRSLHLNTELGLMIDSPELARQGLALFDSLTQPSNSYRVALVPPKNAAAGADAPGTRVVWQTVKDGQPIELTKEPARSDWQRVQVNLMSIIAPDSEL